ncbi:MAG: polysaccharide lyase [Hyphomicrobium sp.]
MRPSLNSILFNAGGLGILLFVAGYMVSSFFHVEVTASCTKRYANGQQFSLQNGDGGVLSPIELQSRVPTREWGLLKNARVVEAQDKQTHYLQVAVGAGEPVEGQDEDADAEDKAKSGGVGFVWLPANITDAKAACLSYRVFIPKDFSFANAGTLPGLYATAEIADLDADQPAAGFVSRVGWQKEGSIGVEVRTPDSAGLWLGTARREGWPVNQWATIEQEVVLSEPGKANGIVRLWVNDELRVDSKGVNLGANDQKSLSGVVADIGYSNPKGARNRLTMSAFIVQRQ